VAGDVLAGIGVLDELEAEGRDLIAFSEQLVTQLRSDLVERLSQRAAADRASARPLALAARRLTGIDASRSGLGGYRWQLELCLLAAADDSERVPATAPPAPAPAAATSASPTATSTPPPSAGRRDGGSETTAEAGKAETPAPPPPAPELEPEAAPAAAVPASSGSPQDELLAIRTAWPQVVAAIGSNPANRPLVTTCRPVELRDGFVVLGFPEDQAFMRDIAERKRHVLEEGIASVIGRPVAVRCVVANLELVEPVDSGEGDLVSRARRIFEDELATIEEID
jgi:DNA polymerase III subunit tau, C-terminal domain